MCRNSVVYVIEVEKESISTTVTTCLRPYGNQALQIHPQLYYTESQKPWENNYIKTRSLGKNATDGKVYYNEESTVLK